MAKIKITISEIEVTGTDDKTVLFQLENAGIYVESHCRGGVCGACSRKLLSGKVDYISGPLAFIPADHFLPCCSVPKTDIVIE